MYGRVKCFGIRNKWWVEGVTIVARIGIRL